MLTDKRFFYTWLLFIGVAFALGFFSVWNLYFIGTDGTAYTTLGKNIATGVGLKLCGATHTFYPPGYPLAIGFFYIFLRDAELAGHLVSFFAYVGTVALTFLLAWRLRPSLPFVIVAASVVALHPSLIQYASSVMAEGLFVCIIAASAYCCWRLSQEETTPYWLWLVWGALLGFAYMIRADGILYAPLQGLYILLWGVENRRSLLIKSALAALACLLVMGPFLIFIHNATGKWQLSTKTPIILEYARAQAKALGGRGETQATSQLSADGKTFTIDKSKDTLGAYLLREPGDALRRVYLNTKQLITKPGINFGWIQFLLLAILLFGQGRRIFNKKAAFIIAHFLPILLFLVLYIDIRFLLTFVPFLALGMARALEQIWDWIWTQRQRAFSFPIVLAVFMAGLIAGSTIGHNLMKRSLNKYYAIFAQGKNLPIEHREMGYWIKENLKPEPTTRITHRNPWVSFYAEACHTRTPYTDSLEVLVKWMRDTETNYLIVDERMTKPYYPGLAFLLDETKHYPDLRPIHTITQPHKIVLYQLEGV